MPIYELFKPFAKETKIKWNLKMAKEEYDGAKRSLKGFITSDEFAMYNKFRKLSKKEKNKTKLKFMDKSRKWKAHFEREGVELMVDHFIDAVKIFYEYFKTLEKRGASQLNMIINICNGEVGDAYTNFKDWKEHSLEMLELLREGSEISIDYRITELFWGANGKMNEGYYLRQSMLVKEAMEYNEHRCLVFMLVKTLRTIGQIRECGGLLGGDTSTLEQSWNAVKYHSTEEIQSYILKLIDMIRTFETEDEEVWEYIIEIFGKNPYSMFGEIMEDSKEW